MRRFILFSLFLFVSINTALAEENNHYTQQSGLSSLPTLPAVNIGMYTAMQAYNQGNAVRNTVQVNTGSINLPPQPNLNPNYKLPQLQMPVLSPLPSYQKVNPSLSVESLNKDKIYPETKLAESQVMTDSKLLTNTAKEP